MVGSLKSSIKQLSRNHFWLRYALLSAWRSVYSPISIIRGRNRSGSNPWNELEAYSQKVFSNYKLWAGGARFHGRVAEVGPGGATGIAKRFIDEGCSQVDQVDRFVHPNDNNHPGIIRYREPAEKFFLSHGPYDFIVSCAVMEHLYDPLAAFRSMASALAPGGTMIHVIDCRDHGQFSDSSHELSFLRIPKLLYKPLTFASGLNRCRLSAYLELAKELDLKYTVLILHLTGIPEDINPAVPFESLDPELVERSLKSLSLIRPRLAKPFRDMDDRDLTISTFALVASR